MSQPPSIDETIAPLPLKKLAEVLIKHYELHEGLWDTVLEFQVAIGKFGPSADVALPGVITGVSKVGLVKVAAMGPDTVDAAMVNPKKDPRLVEA